MCEIKYDLHKIAQKLNKPQNLKFGPLRFVYYYRITTPNSEDCSGLYVVRKFNIRSIQAIGLDL